MTKAEPIDALKDYPDDYDVLLGRLWGCDSRCAGSRVDTLPNGRAYGWSVALPGGGRIMRYRYKAYKDNREIFNSVSYFRCVLIARRDNADRVTRYNDDGEWDIPREEWKD